MKLIGRGQNFSVMTVELPLADHVHHLNAGKEDACAAKDLEPEHWPNDPFDCPMILLDDIVEVLALAQLDVAVMLGVVAPGSPPCSHRSGQW
jgi:hypothetical protein